MSSIIRLVKLAVCAFLLAAPSAAAQNAAPAGPNGDPVYQQLRNITLASDAYTIENIDLKRDAATFHLKSGTMCFVPPVQGKVTGAVFVGEGSMSFDAPSPGERRSLKLLTKSDEFAEIFNHLVLRFTDSTYDEIKKNASKSQGSCDEGLLKDSQNAMRHKLHYNLDGRILEDVLRPEPTGMFMAFVHGKHYDDKLLFVLDPNGSAVIYSEEVGLMTYNEDKSGVWAAFRLSKEYRTTMGTTAARTSSIHIDTSRTRYHDRRKRQARRNGQDDSDFPYSRVARGASRAVSDAARVKCNRGRRQTSRIHPGKQERRSRFLRDTSGSPAAQRKIHDNDYVFGKGSRPKRRGAETTIRWPGKIGIRPTPAPGSATTPIST